VLFDETLVIVASRSHAWAGRRGSLADLRDERWLLFPELPGHPESSGTIARNLLQQHHVGEDRIRAIDSLSAQRALARAGYGLAFVPESAVAEDVAAGQLIALDVRDARVSAPVTLVTRRNSFQSGATRALLDRLTARPG
jgi:DNA-binding transcriptional LysR family regulator